MCSSEAAAHAVATLAEATLQGGGQIVLAGETAAAVGALTGVQDANGINTHTHTDASLFCNSNVSLSILILIKFIT